MQFQTSTKNFLFICTLAATNANAIPSAYVSNYGSLFIENPTNSTLLRDTEKSQTVWVLPPNSGETQFKGLTPSANLGFCPGIANLMKASNDIDARIGQLAQKKMELIPELEEAERALQAAHKNKGEIASSGAIKDMLLLQTEISDIESRQLELLDRMESCENSCEQVVSEFREISTHLAEQRGLLRSMQEQNREETKKLRQAEARVESAEAVLDSVGTRYEKLVVKLSHLSNQVFDMFSNKGKLEGGIALIDYDTGWENNVKFLEGKYANYDFKMIPTANVRIFANIAGANDQNSYIQSLPQLLDYTINGTKYVPWGQVDHTASALPSVLTGNMRLSTIGACPLAVKNFFENTGFTPKTNASADPLYSISATYAHPVAYKFKVKASYNLYKFYEMIKKSGSKGGFFSTRSYSKVLETKTDRDTFHIDWLIEDPNSQFTFEKRQQITAEIKKDLINRVLVTMAQPAISSSDQATFIDPGTPPEAGSLVLAKGLSKTCGWNIYCQAGSWVLRGAQAIFGSSTSEQTFKSTWNRTAEETWSTEVASYRSGATSFRR